MKFTILALLLSTAALADSAPLTNVTVYTGAEHDAFSTCAAIAAVTQVIDKIPGEQGYALNFVSGTTLDFDETPQMTAEMSLVATRGTDNRLLTLNLRSLDADKGWRSEMGRDIFFVSTSVDTTARLFAANVDLGAVDLSGCR